LDFIYPAVVIGTALVMWLASAVPYGVVLGVVNLVYRASSGRFFRWFSAATVVPFLLLLLVWIALAHAAWSTYPGPK
jgi:hypothetical protein